MKSTKMGINRGVGGIGLMILSQQNLIKFPKKEIAQYV
jgi:hypothetical protein